LLDSKNEKQFFSFVFVKKNKISTKIQNPDLEFPSKSDPETILSHLTHCLLQAFYAPKQNKLIQKKRCLKLLFHQVGTGTNLPVIGCLDNIS